MAVITEAEALAIVSLVDMKMELRIDGAITEHDSLITSQIVSAVRFVSRTTGAEGDELLPLRAAAISLCRELYDGHRELSPRSTVYGLLEAFQSYKAG